MKVEPNPIPLARLSSLLLGDRWQVPLSRLLSVDERLVRRWASGERPVPKWVIGEVRRLLERRLEEIQSTLKRL